MIKHSKVCFIRYPNTSKSFKKARLRLVFSIYFRLSVWISDETCFLVFDILLFKLNSYKISFSSDLPPMRNGMLSMTVQGKSFDKV